MRTSGPAVYVKYISEIVPSLDVLKAQAGSQGIFIHRLMFAIRYADFHRRLMQEDRQEAAQELVTLLRDEIAPKSWWGLLLCDAVPLLESGKPFSRHCPMQGVIFSSLILLYFLLNCITQALIYCLPRLVLVNC
jgi:hypothetical protein